MSETTLPFDQQSFPEIYERALVAPLFRPWAELVIDDVGLRRGERALDVACGTGIVARLAKARVGETGTVVGVDVSSAMLSVARRVAPAVEWREGDAAALPLRHGEQFDVVFCQQGVQFFSERAAAAREMRRALAPDGRAAVSTWRPDHETPLVRELRGAAERHVGPIIDRRHSFGEPGPLEALLADAGFREVRSKTVTRAIRFSDGMVFVRLNAIALVGMSAGGKGMSEGDRARAAADIARESTEVLHRYTDGSGSLVFELSTNLTLAKR